MATSAGISEADQNEIIANSKLPVEVEKFIRKYDWRRNHKNL